jgi:hypothetical protein
MINIFNCLIIIVFFFCLFLSFKIFIDGNTGQGKTTTSIFFARLYRELFPNNIIYANFNINISNFIYSQFLLLPFSDIEKGNCMIIFDDTYVSKKLLSKYISILAVLSRKVNVCVIFTTQYYTMLVKENRALCHAKLIPNLTNLINIKGKKQMSEKSELILDVFNPITEKYIKSFKVKKILYIVKEYFNTNEIVKFPNESLLIKEIAKFSNDLSDVEFNLSLISNNQNQSKRMLKQILEIKDF